MTRQGTDQMSMHGHEKKQPKSKTIEERREDVSFKRGEEEKREGKGPSKYVTSFP